MAHPMKLAIGLNESGADPALFPTLGGLGAAADYLIEGLVDGESEFLAANGSLQSCRHVKLIEGKDSTGIRGPPGDGDFGPREDSLGVGLKKALWGKFAGDGHQSISIGLGGIGEGMGRGEEGGGGFQGSKLCRASFHRGHGPVGAGPYRTLGGKFAISFLTS